MKFIAHRGNTEGVNLSEENTVPYISSALDQGFDAEVDVWYLEGSYWLGHDNPAVKVDCSFLEDSRLWCHAKNLASLEKLLSNAQVHCFWHQEDDFTLTSRGYIWTYPHKDVGQQSVLVIRDARNYKGRPCQGLCSDYF